MKNTYSISTEPSYQIPPHQDFSRLQIQTQERYYANCKDFCESRAKGVDPVTGILL